VACFIVGLGTLLFISANRVLGIVLLCDALVSALLWWRAASDYHE
jgi:hypothetical protein